MNGRTINLLYFYTLIVRRIEAFSLQQEIKPTQVRNAIINMPILLQKISSFFTEDIDLTFPSLLSSSTIQSVQPIFDGFPPCPAVEFFSTYGSSSPTCFTY